VLRQGLSARAALPSEADLVARARRGDGQAFGLLYDRHVDAVYRYVRVRVMDTPLAEDLTHDVFVAALGALPRFRWRGNLRPWLLSIAHNRLANYWRSADRRPADAEPADDDEVSPDPADVDPSGDPEARIEARLRTDALVAACSDLTDLEAEVLALRIGLEWSLSEVAHHLGRSEAAVSSLQYRAVQRLARALRDREGEP
jgi:RNA polymerase sigma-70 factor (ECF subfamily)